MGDLRLNHVSHSYFSKKGYTKAVKDIDLNIKEGSFVTLLGPSGCGKTTILSIISGLLKPTQGEVTFNNRSLEEEEIQVGYMLQQDYLFPWKSIIDNVLIGPRLQKQDLRVARKKAEHLLKEIGLGSVMESNPSELSGGMRQRVALVRTLITNPSLFLLDEPFSALDYQTKLQMENLVLDILKQYDTTSVLVTHDIGEAIAMSDEIVLLKSNPGRVSKIISIPESLRKMEPFDARQHEDFSPLFQTIWEELKTLEDETEAPFR